MGFIKKYALWIVVAFAFVLRFWALGNNPPSLYWDEVSQGYNAYSILKTGFDEHHEFLPIARFQAFGDYKAPVYIYLDILPQIFFGQSEFAVRFPSAFFGSITVLLSYLLTKELFFEHKRRKGIAIFTALLLAVSPWHIQLSRVAYEANIATFFTVTAIYLFLFALRKNIRVLFFSVLSFIIAFYSFNAHRIFIPLMVILLLTIYWKKLHSNLKISLFAVAFGVILLIPFLFYFKSPESRLRFAEVNIFSDISQVELSNRLTEEDNNSFFGKIIHNRRILYGISYIKHYLDFQNPSYLFFKGDENPRFSTQQNGELYLIMLPFILIGVYKIIKIKDKTRYLILGWFLLAPIAAATARETPHALRSETFIPLYEIFAGLGFIYFYDWLKKFKNNIKIGVLASLFIIFIYSFINFLHTYYVHLPAIYSQDFQYGYKQTVEKVEKIKDNYDEIIFSNAYGRAYMYVLWYGKYLPNNYWEKGRVSRDAFGFYNVESFGKYKFIIPSALGAKEKRVLYVGAPGEVSKKLRQIEKIKFLDGKDAFIIADNL